MTAGEVMCSHRLEIFQRTSAIFGSVGRSRGEASNYSTLLDSQKMSRKTQKTRGFEDTLVLPSTAMRSHKPPTPIRRTVHCIGTQKMRRNLRAAPCRKQQLPSWPTAFSPPMKALHPDSGILMSSSNNHGPRVLTRSENQTNT